MICSLNIVNHVTAQKVQEYIEHFEDLNLNLTSRQWREAKEGVLQRSRDVAGLTAAFFVLISDCKNLNMHYFDLVYSGYLSNPHFS